MRVTFLLTPSTNIHGLPEPTPKAGQTCDLVDSLALDLIKHNIVVPAESDPPKMRKKKLKAVPQEPAISRTEAPKIGEKE